MAKVGLDLDNPGDLEKYKDLTGNAAFQSGERVVVKPERIEPTVEVHKKKLNLIAVAAGKPVPHQSTEEAGGEHKG